MSVKADNIILGMSICGGLYLGGQHAERASSFLMKPETLAFMTAKTAKYIYRKISEVAVQHGSGFADAGLWIPFVRHIQNATQGEWNSDDTETISIPGHLMASAVYFAAAEGGAMEERMKAYLADSRGCTAHDFEGIADKIANAELMAMAIEEPLATSPLEVQEKGFSKINSIEEAIGSGSSTLLEHYLAGHKSKTYEIMKAVADGLGEELFAAAESFNDDALRNLVLKASNRHNIRFYHGKTA